MYNYFLFVLTFFNTINYISSSVASTPSPRVSNQPTTTCAYRQYNAANDFSNVQGYNGWYYGYYSSGTFTQFTNYAYSTPGSLGGVNSWNYNINSNGNIGSSMIMPNGAGACNTASYGDIAPVLRWYNPIGSCYQDITITFSVNHGSPSGGIVVGLTVNGNTIYSNSNGGALIYSNVFNGYGVSSVELSIGPLNHICDYGQTTYSLNIAPMGQSNTVISTKTLTLSATATSTVFYTGIWLDLGQYNYAMGDIANLGPMTINQCQINCWLNPLCGIIVVTTPCYSIALNSPLVYTTVCGECWLKLTSGWIINTDDMSRSIKNVNRFMSYTTSVSTSPSAIATSSVVMYSSYDMCTNSGTTVTLPFLTSRVLIKTNMYSSTYLNNNDCKFYVNGAGIAQALRVTIQSMATEKCCDFLSVYDEASNLIIRYSGVYINYSFLVTSPSISIHFTSDSSVVSSGISILVDLEYASLSASPSVSSSSKSSSSETASASSSSSVSISPYNTRSLVNSYSSSVSAKSSKSTSISSSFSRSGSVSSSVSNTNTIYPSTSNSVSTSVTNTLSLSTSNSVSTSVTNTLSTSASNSISISGTNSISASASNSVSTSGTNSISASASNSVSTSGTNSISASASNSVSTSVTNTLSPSTSNSVSTSVTNTISTSASNSVSTSGTNSISASASNSVSTSGTNSISASASNSVSTSASSSVSNTLSPTLSPSTSISMSTCVTKTLSSRISNTACITKSIAFTYSPIVTTTVSSSVSISVIPSISPTASYINLLPFELPAHGENYNAEVANQMNNFLNDLLSSGTILPPSIALAVINNIPPVGVEDTLNILKKVGGVISEPVSFISSVFEGALSPMKNETISINSSSYTISVPTIPNLPPNSAVTAISWSNTTSFSNETTLSNIMSVSVSSKGVDQPIQNLTEPLVLNWKLPDIENPPNMTLSCSYWNYTSSSWISDGCELINNNGSVQCACSHMTDFAVRFERVAEMNKNLFENACNVYTLEGLQKYKNYYIFFGVYFILMILTGIGLQQLDIKNSRQYLKSLKNNFDIIKFKTEKKNFYIDKCYINDIIDNIDNYTEYLIHKNKLIKKIYNQFDLTKYKNKQELIDLINIFIDEELDKNHHKLSIKSDNTTSEPDIKNKHFCSNVYNLISLWWKRLLYQHNYLSIFFKYDPQSPRIFRVFFLFTVISHTLFMTALLYGYSHSLSGSTDSASPVESVVLSIITSLINVPFMNFITKILQLAGKSEFEWRYPFIYREIKKMIIFEEVYYKDDKKDTENEDSNNAVNNNEDQEGMITNFLVNNLYKYCTCCGNKKDIIKEKDLLFKDRINKEIIKLDKIPLNLKWWYTNYIPFHTSRSIASFFGCLGYLLWTINYLLLFSADNQPNVQQEILTSFGISQLFSIVLITPLTLLFTLLFTWIYHKYIKKTNFASNIIPIYYHSDPFINNKSFGLTVRLTKSLFLNSISESSIHQPTDPRIIAPSKGLIAQLLKEDIINYTNKDYYDKIIKYDKINETLDD